MINQALAANEITNTAISGTISNLSAGEGLAFYIGNLWRTVITLGGIAFLLYLVWGGLEWMMAAGDKTKVENAQHKISSALIGLVVLVSSYAVTLFIQGVFKINILRPVFPINY